MHRQLEGAQKGRRPTAGGGHATIDAKCSPVAPCGWARRTPDEDTHPRVESYHRFGRLHGSLFKHLPSAQVVISQLVSSIPVLS